MSIKQNGGVFGRNPTFNDVTIEGQLTFDGDIDINSDLTVDGTIKADSVLVDTATNNYVGTPLAVGDNTKSQSGLNIQTSPTGYGYVLFGDGAGASSYIGQINYNHSNDKMTLKTAGNDRAVIDASGINVAGNVIIGTSGKGIDFSATAGPSTNELLDDYEQGNWTPTLTMATGGPATGYFTGKYTKVGRMVYCHGQFALSSLGGGSGLLTLGGLPFTAVSSGVGDCGGGVSIYGAGLSLANASPITFTVGSNSTSAGLKTWSAAGTSNVQASEFSATAIFYFAITYTAANL